MKDKNGNGFDVNGMWSVFLNKEQIACIENNTNKTLTGVVVRDYLSKKLKNMLSYIPMSVITNYCKSIFEDRKQEIVGRLFGFTRGERNEESQQSKEFRFGVSTDSIMSKELFDYAKIMKQYRISCNYILKALFVSIMELEDKNFINETAEGIIRGLMTPHTYKVMKCWFENKDRSPLTYAILKEAVRKASEINDKRILFRAYDYEDDCGLLSYTNSYENAERFNTNRIKSIQTFNYLDLNHIYKFFEFDDLTVEKEFIVDEFDYNF